MANIYEKLAALPIVNPKIQDKLCSERQFIIMAKALLPNFPDDVLGQWAYDNWPLFCDKSFYNLDYTKLVFEQTVRDVCKVPRTGGRNPQEVGGDWV